MIGIFGGTFDPIHFGHLRTALEVQEAARLESIHFVPLKEAVHRDQPGTPAELRCALVSAAISSQPGFTLDDRELRRQGPSYSYYTLESFRQQWPEQSLAFILGDDAFKDFLSWHRPEDILKLAHLIVMRRPGEHDYDDDLQALVDHRQVISADELHAEKAGKILFQPVTQLDISATDIRRRCAEGLDISYLLPEQVESIIHRLHLYR